MLARSHIYVLRDPRDGAIRYVGQTVQPKERLQAHMADTRKGCQYRCHRWTRALVAAGFLPIMEIVEHIPGEQADAAEIRWIAHYRGLGADLTNHTAGGRGFRGHKPSKEAVEKRAAALRGKPRSDEAKAAIKAALNKPETRALLSQARIGNRSRTGQRQSDDEKQKRAAANRGKTRSQEFGEAVRQRMLGTRHSEETKRKMGETKRATISAERRSEIARAANLASQEAKRCRSRAE